MATNPRRSERIQSKKLPNNAKDTTSVVGNPKSAIKTQKGTNPAPKRRKIEDALAAQPNIQTAARPDRPNVKGRRGRLGLITEIPLDALHEVLRHLEPVDLLHMSWASKSLRTVVMENSARYIWKEAFEKLYRSKPPPPRCPEDLNLAQYAHFLFTKKCMQCYTAVKCWSSWTLRLRVCWGCLQSEQFTTISQGYPCLPTISARNKCFALTCDYLKASRCRTRCAHKQSPKKYRIKGLGCFEKWENKRKNERETRLDILRRERQAVILDKLVEAGWTKSEIRDITHGMINKLPGFMRAKKLTETDWDALRPQLVKRLQELKTMKEHPNDPLSWKTYVELLPFMC